MTTKSMKNFRLIELQAKLNYHDAQIKYHKQRSQEIIRELFRRGY